MAAQCTLTAISVDAELRCHIFCCSSFVHWLFFIHTYIYIYIFTILLLLQMRHISGLGFRHGIRFDSSSSSTTLQLHSRNMSTDCGLLLHFPFDCSPHSPFPLAFPPTNKWQTRTKAKATYNLICSTAVCECSGIVAEGVGIPPLLKLIELINVKEVPNHGLFK